VNGESPASPSSLVCDERVVASRRDERSGLLCAVLIGRDNLKMDEI